MDFIKFVDNIIVQFCLRHKKKIVKDYHWNTTGGPCFFNVIFLIQTNLREYPEFVKPYE